MINVIDFLNVVDTLAIIENELYVWFSFLTFKVNSFPRAVYSKLSVQSFLVFLNLTLLFNKILDIGINFFDEINIFSFEAFIKSIVLLLKYKSFLVLFTK